MEASCSILHASCSMLIPLTCTLVKFNCALQLPPPQSFLCSLSVFAPFCLSHYKTKCSLPFYSSTLSSERDANRGAPKPIDVALQLAGQRLEENVRWRIGGRRKRILIGFKRLAKNRKGKERLEISLEPPGQHLLLLILYSVRKT